MKKTSKLSRLLRFFWLAGDGKINPKWENFLIELMETGMVTDLNQYTITFNNSIEVWINNHPFCSGALYSLGNGKCADKISESSFQVSKKTRIRLEDFVNSLLEKQKVKEKDVLDKVILDEVIENFRKTNNRLPTNK